MKVENIHLVGFEPSLRGMRNPKDSWANSDSVIFRHYNPLSPEFEELKKAYPPENLYKDGKDGFLSYQYDYTKQITEKNENNEDVTKTLHIFNTVDFNPYISKYVIRTLRQNYFDGTYGSKHDPVESDFDCYIPIDTDHVILIGPADFKLMKTLANGGPVHRKYARMIQVYIDVTGSFDFWKEYDTYKVATVANSCSTMHTITRHPLSLDNYSKADLRPCDIEQIQKNIDYINNNVLNDETLDDLEKTRIISKLNLTGFEQKRTLLLNYETIANICLFRRNHKLAEWRYLSNQIFMRLPYFADLFYTKYEEGEEISE